MILSHRTTATVTLSLIGTLLGAPARADSSVVLPSGCGTAAYTKGGVQQDTQNPQGEKCFKSAAGGGAVTIADGADVAQGAKADAAYTTGSGSVVSILKGIFGRLAAPLTVQGDAASGATAAGNPLLGGGRAATTNPTAVADGQAVAAMLDKAGRTVTWPYSPLDLAWRGSQNSTSTGALTIQASSGSASTSNYVGGCQLVNNGASDSIVTLNDSASTVLTNPHGGGSNVTFSPPLKVAANTAFTATLATASTTQYVNCQGFVAAP